MTHSDIHPPSSTWEEKQVQLEKLVASVSGNDPSNTEDIEESVGDGGVHSSDGDYLPIIRTTIKCNC